MTSNVSSGLHKNTTINLNDLQSEEKFRGMKVYGMTKLADILFTYRLHDKLIEENIDGISVNVMHPGLVRTNLGRNSSFIQRIIYNHIVTRFMGVSPEESAKTIDYLATANEVATISGKYWHKEKQVDSSELSYDKEIQESLWNKTEELLKDYV